MRFATCGYAALQESYRKLADQHRELNHLCAAYVEVIGGSLPGKGQTASIDQIWAEAGREGLRSRALEADVLKPIIREAGGLQALVSQTQSMQSLIKKTGGLLELESLVSQALKIRGKLGEVGGLQSFSHLVSDLSLLQTNEQKQAELRCNLDGPNGLMTKATRYDMLEQAFTEFQTASAHTVCQQEAPENTRVASTGVPHRAPKESTQHEPHDNTSSISNAVATINPERASRMSATLIEDDPDRDLYEATPFVTKPLNKTGSNNVPLGRHQPIPQFSDMKNTQKNLGQKGKNNLQANAKKRPRIDVGRAAALIQISFADRNSFGDYSSANQARAFSGSLQSGGYEVTEEHLRKIDPQLEINGNKHKNLANKRPKLTTVMTSGAHSNRSATSSFVYPSYRPTVETRDCGIGQGNPHLVTVPIIGISHLQESMAALFRRYPVALWIGPSDPDAKQRPFTLARASQVPQGLVYFLASALTNFINHSTIFRWNGMQPDDSTCILQHLVDSYKPSALPRRRRACENCSSGTMGSNRPCALLQNVDGVITVVFLPLHEELRRDVTMEEKNFWML